ncbi:hypothetical protein ABZ914_24880 [Spirillospora sp. NPDC046719]
MAGARLIDTLERIHDGWGGDGLARLRITAETAPRAEARAAGEGAEILVSTGLVELIAAWFAAEDPVPDEPAEQAMVQSLYLLYLHEVGHVLHGHLRFPLPGASGPGLRMVDHPMALVAARAAFEFEADRWAVRQFVWEASGGDDLDAESLLLAVVEAAMAASVMTEVMDRHVHARDGAARLWSALGRFDEMQIHPPLLLRRFLMLDSAVRLVDGEGPRRAVEKAWGSGTALAHRSDGPMPRLLGSAFLELAQEYRDPHAMANELDARLRLIRELGLVPTTEGD